jgi:DNA-binding MarR family transcriptional regulator
MSEEDPQVPFPAELASLSEFRFRLRQFLNFSEAASDRAGIQAQQYQLMQVVAAVPDDEQASISYLAERMVLRHNSTVELVDRAEKANLVARHSDPKDLRRSIVKLTPQGEAIFRKLLAEHIVEARRVSEELIAALEAMKASGKA